MAATSRQARPDPAAMLLDLLRDPITGADKLHEVPIFSRFTPEERRRVWAIGDVHKVQAQAHVVIEGEPTSGMYIVLAGRVSVHKADMTSNALTRLAILEEGAIFGELTLFDRAPRSATVVADSASVLFHLPAEIFEAFLTSEGEDLSLRFYRTCAESLAARFRTLNGDYLASQRLLWKHALRREK